MTHQSTSRCPCTILLPARQLSNRRKAFIKFRLRLTDHKDTGSTLSFIFKRPLESLSEDAFTVSSPQTSYSNMPKRKKTDSADDAPYAPDPSKVRKLLLLIATVTADRL